MAAMRDVAGYFSIGLSPLPTPSAKLRTLSPAGERQFTPEAAQSYPPLSMSAIALARPGLHPRPCSRCFTPGELPMIGDPTRAQ